MFTSGLLSSDIPIEMADCSLSENISAYIKAMPEKCLNSESFLVRISLYLVQIQENMDQKKLRIWTLFTHTLKVLSKPDFQTVIFLGTGKFAKIEQKAT